MPDLPALALSVDKWQLSGDRSGRYEGVSVYMYVRVHEHVEGQSTVLVYYSATHFHTYSPVLFTVTS